MSENATLEHGEGGGSGAAAGAGAISTAITSRVTFATQQNSVPIIRDLSVANTGAEPLEDLILEMTSAPGFLRVTGL